MATTLYSSVSRTRQASLVNRGVFSLEDLNSIAQRTQLSTVNKYKPTVQLSTVTTGLNKLNTTDNCTSNEEIDLLLEDCTDLVNVKFKGWYAQAFRRLGRDMVTRLASQARADGKEPARLFSYLLKRA